MSEQKKDHQPALRIEAQIANLKAIGLSFADEEWAKQILSSISYFRLIKAYSLRLKDDNGKYYSGVTFEQIYELYCFNKDFRSLLFPLIEDLEISLRCRISNYFGNKYGVEGYLDKANFQDEDNYNVLRIEIDKAIKYNSMSPFVKNFQDNYTGGTLPVYALFEVLTFGTLSKLFKNMHNSDKKAISKEYGVPYVYLESWIESIAHIRNICAHYGRLYNAKLTKTPKLFPHYNEINKGRENNQRIRNNRIFGVLLCLKELTDSSRWNSFVAGLIMLKSRYRNVNMSTMGFPKDWQEFLVRENND